MVRFSGMAYSSVLRNPGRCKLRARKRLPAAEALPLLGGLAITHQPVLAELGRGGAGVVGEDAQQRADGKALEVDRAAAAPRDDAMLLVGVGDDEVVDRPAPHVANHSIA